jgi:hypothetical protein
VSIRRHWTTTFSKVATLECGFERLTTIPVVVGV